MTTPSALSTLRLPVFRMLWGTWLAANTCMWMNDVAAAWMMTTLSVSPAMVSLVLALTFANGIGLAMRWPVFAAIVPELVPREQLPGALALNGVAMNASRIIGPILAGAIIASLGSP